MMSSQNLHNFSPKSSQENNELPKPPQLLSKSSQKIMNSQNLHNFSPKFSQENNELPKPPS
jgi:hypothetical protein